MAPRSRNPVGFGPLPVTVLSTLVYLGLFAALLITHHVVPSAPKTATPKLWPGVNLTTAWLDLEDLTQHFHPFNSKSNVQVRDWLLTRIADILDANQAQWKIVPGNATLPAQTRPKPVTLFNDNKSNITYSDMRGIHYFEGDNIMLYIRGSEDDAEDWWLSDSPYDGPGGVLVNAHYDSVSTGFGATDDGVGVITILQLVSHFTKDGNQPKRGIVALLNNAEEDGLYGAKAFTQHPLAHFPHTFLNLEGAGAGGRATLFRSTDTEVTKFYAGTKYPFGTVVSGDGFKRGFVRSGTDYSVFTQDLGMRGLDVAFMEPRARYHTEQDDTRDTSRDSLWHMLSAALATVKGLSKDTSSTFESPKDESRGKVNAGKGSDGVWFDILGRAFAVLQLHTLFALSVTLLVAGPILLILLEIGVQKSGKWYLFSRKQYLHSSDDDEPVSLFGWRGFFRFPMAFVIATAAVVALAFLLTKINPLILYSSEYAVWSMMLSAWLSVAWFVLRLGDSIRPSAFSRVYTLLWMYALSWIALVAVTVGETQLHLASGYFMVIYNAAIFLALLISYLEMFALPKKSVYAEHTIFGADAAVEPHQPNGSIRSANDEPPRGREGPNADADENDEANERTSLLNSRQTFTRYGRDRRHSEVSDENAPLIQDPLLNKAYEGEQAWSSSLPKWTWLLQFLILGPINIILVGQIALLTTSATHQTPADGNSVFLIYVLIAALSVLLLLPLSPFMHRLTYHVTTAMFLVFVGTLIYNLTAFPFSRDNRLKVYFIQQVDLDTGNNSVALTGLDPFLHDIIGELPSAAGQDLNCSYHDWAARNELTTCVWAGLAPNVVPLVSSPDSGARYPNNTFRGTIKPHKPKAAKQPHWFEYNVTRADGGKTNTSNELIFDLKGTNTRACRIYVNAAVSNLTVEGAGSTAQGFVPPGYLDGRDETQIRLWSRSWGGAWRVHVTVDDEKKVKSPVEGKVMCIWSDANQAGTIPALDEVKHSMPVWSTVSKGADGLVEAFRRFRV